MQLSSYWSMLAFIADEHSISIRVSGSAAHEKWISITWYHLDQMRDGLRRERGE